VAPGVIASGVAGDCGAARSAERWATVDPGQRDPAEELIKQPDHVMVAPHSAMYGGLARVARTEAYLAGHPSLDLARPLPAAAGGRGG
jgi:hypothetical protein